MPELKVGRVLLDDVQPKRHGIELESDTRPSPQKRVKFQDTQDEANRNQPPSC